MTTYLPSKEEWDLWRLHPVTKTFLALLAQRREDLKDQWAVGAFTDQGQFGTAILNARAIGGCTVLGDILNFDYEQLLGAMSDEEHIGAGTPGSSNPGRAV